jgi:hypothetical protein
MKLHSFAALVALAVAPAALAAQQNSPEGQRARPGGAPMFQALINHRQQLELSDAQVERLRGISQRLESRNAPLQARARDLFERAGLGELRARNAPNGRGMRGGRGQRGGRGARPQLTEQQRQALQRVHEQLIPIRRQMMDNRIAAMREAQDLLTPQQRQQVQRVMRQHRRRGGHPGMGRPGRGPGRGRGRAPGQGWGGLN